MAKSERKSILTLPGRKLAASLRKLGRLCRGPEDKLSGEVTFAGATWRVEIAMTAGRRYVGLSGRAELAPRTGMLFLYPNAIKRNFSMRGCLVPLDIAFLSPSLEVVSVYTMHVEPDRRGRTQYPSAGPAQYVLETPAGELLAAGVAVGSKATFSAGIPGAFWSDPAPPGAESTLEA